MQQVPLGRREAVNLAAAVAGPDFHLTRSDSKAFPRRDFTDDFEVDTFLHIFAAFGCI